MDHYLQTLDSLRAQPRSWLVTGVAGFIGSHLLETLLRLGQRVTGVDDFSSGSRANLDEVKGLVPGDAWSNFRFIEGSVADIAACREAVRGTDYVLNQAGFVSVPLSMEDPVRCNQTNVDGFLNILTASHEAGVKRLVYASSSAVYGDDDATTKTEEKIGSPLSPYAASKWMNEIYAGVFRQAYGFDAIGLRYFNIFGPRQNPKGGYAAVIPVWITTLAKGRPCFINGSGGITRDFCHVRNVVQANILAALASPAQSPEARVYNVAYGRSFTLLELHMLIADKLAARKIAVPAESPLYHPPRAGDIIHSAADTSKIRAELDFTPAVSLEEGLEDTVDWYLKF
jgi:UDP-N-acetylglucosamine/UDP-N-acetylgalactosamine 4-epimerase